MPSPTKDGPPLVDTSRDMEESAWWDLWNSSYRTIDNYDEVSNELFTRASAEVNEITERKGGRILEVGCGAGSVSRMLNFSVYRGVDMSSAAIAVAKGKNPYPLESGGAKSAVYEAADFHAWPIPSEPFDVVACVDAISCFRDQRLVLQKFAECLRPGGKLVLTTINPFVYYRIRPVWENGPVSHWLSRRELHALVKSAGFKIEKSFTIMPRGKLGILLFLNARRLNQAFGPGMEKVFRRWKEQVGLGEYRVLVARKP
jgi:2-polyprenyl-3-methyl-5-hydroxy-6-metoxy-1,4-benzoquinol methylase